MNFENERLVSPQSSEFESKTEQGLRPKKLTEFIGQRSVVSNIEVMIHSALKRSTALDHVLLSGPPGLGKTSLAYVVAQNMKSNIHCISGPALEKKGDLAALLTNLAATDVLFIDEIHRMPIAIEEILYSAMEDYRIDIVIGQGASSRTMSINIEPFTLIAATTRPGMLSNPLRDRFIAHLHFDFYADADLEIILKHNAAKVGIDIDANALSMMAKCSRGTPRIANRLLRRVRDFSIFNDRNTICLTDVFETLKMLEIDKVGLDRMDRKILSVILDYYGGGPVGIEALSATLSEDRETIEDVYEPYLLKEGYLIRTPRGRECSAKGKKHLADLQN